MPMSLRFTIALVLSIISFAIPSVASAQVQTFTATHTYVLGDHDSKDDARQRCLLEAKRKILEQAGVYIESVSEVKNFDLTKDKITSFAAAVMQVKDTKEEVDFQQGHMTLTLKLTAQVDLEEVRKQLAARQLDAGVRDDVAAQKERLKRLEAHIEAMMQRQPGGHSSGDVPDSPPIDISAEDLKRLHTQAAQGDATAQYNLGVLYLKGHGVPQDYAKARQWWEKAAAQGDATAQTTLGILYDNGLGVPQDHAKARQWYEKAAAQGEAKAQSLLGFQYQTGLGVPQDYAKARQWWEKAAAQGDAVAQSWLGFQYERGLDVPQDYAKASQWYEKAAAQGDAKAQGNLGLLYANGKGVPQDYVKARQWYEKGAAQGDAWVQYKLGALYYNGEGVPQDYVRAYMWLNLAAANSTGDEQKTRAKDRDAVARLMTPAQIADAQRLSQQCTAQQFKGC